MRKHLDSHSLLRCVSHELLADPSRAWAGALFCIKGNFTFNPTFRAPCVPA